MYCQTTSASAAHAFTHCATFCTPWMIDTWLGGWGWQGDAWGTGGATRGEYETLLAAHLALFNLVTSFDPAAPIRKGAGAWDVPVEWLEATLHRKMCACPRTPDRTPLLSLSAAWLDPLRPPDSGGGGGGS